MRIAGVAALIIAAFAMAAPPAGAGSTSGDAEHVLAVVNAAGGTVRPSDDGYRLVLTRVDPRPVWFSERPDRAVGSFTVEELVDAFFSGDDDPNAALEIFEGSAAGDVVVLELSNPRVRRGSARLVLDALILAPDELAASALGAHAERATNDVPRRFGAAALYIDDADACLFGDGGDGGAGGRGGTGGDGGTADSTANGC